MAVAVVIDAVAAPGELARHLRRVGAADLRELGAKARPAGQRRRGQEIRHVATPRQHCQQQRQAEPGRLRPDSQQPGLMIKAPALIGQHLHCRLRLPHRRDGKPHGQQVLAGPERK